MKHFTIKMLLLFFLCFNTLLSRAQNTNTVIAFLRHTPKTSITDCTSEDLMNLLTNESLDWIESIECKNIRTDNLKAGLLISISKDNPTSAYISFKFKSNCIMPAISFFAYGNDLDNTNSKVNIYINDELKKDSSFSLDDKSYSNNCTYILDGLNFKNGGANVPSIPVTGFTPAIPIRSCKIEIPKQNKNVRIQFYGIRVFHNSPIDESDIETIVAEFQAEEDEKSIEYFDMMGRRLPEAPANGIYIRKCGSKVEKLTATGKPQ